MGRRQEQVLSLIHIWFQVFDLYIEHFLDCHRIVSDSLLETGFFTMKAHFESCVRRRSIQKGGGDHGPIPKSQL